MANGWHKVGVEIECRMRESLHLRYRASVRVFIPFAVLTGVFGSVPAFGQDYALRKVGAWTVAASRDQKGCFLSRTYDGAGETTLLLGLDIDGGNHLSVLNENWSIKPKDSEKLTFRLSNGGYPKQPVVGMASGEKRGFVTNFEPKFITYFGTSRTLHIDRGAVPVEQLSLDGSGAAVAELRRCVALYKAKGATGARETGRSDKIPRDPFAPDAKRKSDDRAGKR